MLGTATTVALFSWAAGDLEEKTDCVNEKPHVKQNWNQKYFNLIVYYYISASRQFLVYYTSFCGVACRDVLRCRLRRRQNAHIPPMRRSGAVRWRRVPGRNSAQRWIIRSST